MSRTTCRALAQNLRHVARHFCNAASYSTANKSSTSAAKGVHDELRALLRETAQPVAVVTSFMPPDGSAITTESAFHGATLSSFTSIAMHPYPLVTFALRIPSRMAASLDSARPDAASHMVVNLLSAEQDAVAVKFSRPDLHPHPFDSIPYSLTEEGLPVLEGSLGALSCKLVSKAIPLHDLDFLEKGAWGGRAGVQELVLEHRIASELFIARVTRVERLVSPDDMGKSTRTLPLLYHRRGFITCNPDQLPKKCD